MTRDFSSTSIANHYFYKKSFMRNSKTLDLNFLRMSHERATKQGTENILNDKQILNNYLIPCNFL